MAFIWNAKSSFRIFSILTSTLSCPFVIIQEFYSNMHGLDYSIPHFITRVQGIRIVVTPDLISEVLHVPRVEFVDYPDYPRLQTISKDKLMSFFYETPSSWDECQNTPYSSFAKRSKVPEYGDDICFTSFVSLLFDY